MHIKYTAPACVLASLLTSFMLNFALVVPEHFRSEFWGFLHAFFFGMLHIQLCVVFF